MRHTSPLIALHQKRISEGALDEPDTSEGLQAQVQIMYLFHSRIFSLNYMQSDSWL